jgi:hypothetical protein
MTEIPGIIVPADAELDSVVDQVGMYEPLMALPQTPDEGEGWSGAIDAMIAAGLFEV